MANSRLEQNMAEMKRNQVELVMAQAAFSRSMANMDYSQVGLPRLCVQNEMNQPSQEEMSNLGAIIVELRRVQAELATSRTQFMEEVPTPPQEELNVKHGVDKLAFTMATLAKCGVDLSIKEEMAPMATSYTQTKLEIHQHLQDDEISIQELVAKHMNEGENMAKMSFEGQHERLPSLFEVIKEEGLNYKEDVTSRNKDELEKITKVEDGAQNLKVLVVKEDEPTSPESHERTREEIVKTILEMNL